MRGGLLCAGRPAPPTGTRGLSAAAPPKRTCDATAMLLTDIRPRGSKQSPHYRDAQGAEPEGRWINC